MLGITPLPTPRDVHTQPVAGAPSLFGNLGNMLGIFY